MEFSFILPEWAILLIVHIIGMTITTAICFFTTNPAGEKMPAGMVMGMSFFWMAAIPILIFLAVGYGLFYFYRWLGFPEK